MHELDVALGERSYPIRIGSGLLDDASMWDSVGARALIVTDRNVDALYRQRVVTALGERAVACHVIEAGETSKNLDEFARVLDALVAHGARRDATVVALGGGVVGDLAGFAAASFMRGIAFVQVPTTLLAQVDSSVGGKTGINHAAGKNLIGAFHQPQLVVIDTDTLTTLSDRELRAGAAEVIKSALLADAEFFAWLEDRSGALLARDPAVLAEAIRRCCEIKAGVVARDEQERGERMLLNLGHTFGHAIEQLSGYGVWLHGEAVATGLVMAADLSQRLGMLDAQASRRVGNIVAGAGLPVRAAGLAPQALYDAMTHDKKFRDGRNRFILLNALGRAEVVENIAAEHIMATLQAHSG